MGSRGWPGRTVGVLAFALLAQNRAQLSAIRSGRGQSKGRENARDWAVIVPVGNPDRQAT
jgi:hypothetical protein